MRAAGCIAVLLLAMVAGISAQTGQKPKKFLGGPLVIEDQGSFFVGGVQKITEHAAVPPPPRPAAGAAGSDTAADHDRPDVRAVPDPAEEIRRADGR